MKTVISTDRGAAVELLTAGNIVALPTETVYGLAADALNPIALAKIFETKERPRFDPLIVHLPNREWLEKISELSSSDRALNLKLADQFWPGPLTIVVRKREIVPHIVTAGLETVAIRVSGHPVFADIVRQLGRPLAAPSANRFGQISPTTARHVLDELDGRIPLIIDGGPTQHGIESTIIAVHDGKIDILRHGPITAEQLSHFASATVASPKSRVSAPGQLPSHYAPRTPLRLIENAEAFSPQKTQRVGLLAWTSVKSNSRFAAVRRLSERQNIREAAANLFRYLRELDSLELELIVAERVPPQGLGAAILDRLERASHNQRREQDMPE